MRASDYDTVGLCPRHHDTYPGSLHVLGVKRFPQVYRISELQLLQIVHCRLFKLLPSGHVSPPDPYAVPGVNILLLSKLFDLDQLHVTNSFNFF